MQFKTWQEFFEACGDQRPTFRSNYESMGIISHATVEELYQHFKARLMDEVVADRTEYTNNALEIPKIIKRGTYPLKDKEG